jgi:hypothetical protein
MIETLINIFCARTWDDFKKLATFLRPKLIMYFLQRAPLSRPPLALRIVFISKNWLYTFLDCANGDSFKQTNIPIKGEIGERKYVLHEDVKEFIVNELERRDLDVVSPIFSPARYLTSLFIILRGRGKAFVNATE